MLNNKDFFEQLSHTHKCTYNMQCYGFDSASSAHHQ
jgi:hypothetical protein